MHIVMHVCHMLKFCEEAVEGREWKPTETGATRLRKLCVLRLSLCLKWVKSIEEWVVEEGVVIEVVAGWLVPVRPVMAAWASLIVVLPLCSFASSLQIAEQDIACFLMILYLLCKLLKIAWVAHGLATSLIQSPSGMSCLLAVSLGGILEGQDVVSLTRPSLFILKDTAVECTGFITRCVVLDETVGGRTRTPLRSPRVTVMVTVTPPRSPIIVARS